MIVVAALATIAINQVYFWLAREYGQRRLAALRGHRAITRVIDRVERNGTWFVLCSRFVYGFRIAIPAACGAAAMSLPYEC